MLDPGEPYYTTYTNAESCTTSNDLVLNAEVADTEASALTATANYKYEEDPQLRHQRCNHAGVPVVSMTWLQYYFTTSTYIHFSVAQLTQPLMAVQVMK
jgi:hypothetical protein